MKTEEELLKRAQENDTKAMIGLGNYNRFHKCDFESAFYWYEKALENYDKEALIYIANLYKELDYFETEEEQFELSEGTIGWYENALAYYLEDYTSNFEHACLAAELVSGVECFKEDYDLAFKLYQYVANQKSHEREDETYIRYAQVRLAQMYRYGLGCESDIELSKKYFFKSRNFEKKYDYITFKRY